MIRRSQWLLVLALFVSASGCCLAVDPPPGAVAELNSLGWDVVQLGQDSDVRRPRCTDEDLAQLVLLGPQLGDIHLDLRGTSVTGAGLKTLGVLANIAELHVAGLPIDDAGLVVVQRWRGLQLLNASRTQITDQGLAALASLDQLEVLILDGCSGVTGSGLSFLTAPTLAYLDLSRTSLGDDGMMALPVPQDLTILVLEETAITDRTLERLELFPLLEEVYVFGVVGLSEEAILSLEDAESLPAVVPERKGVGAEPTASGTEPRRSEEVAAPWGWADALRAAAA